MNSSDGIEILAIIILLSFVAFNAVDRLVESSNQETVEIVPLLIEKQDLESVGTKERLWENCSHPHVMCFSRSINALQGRVQSPAVVSYI